ncbi:hypothetical protein [Salinicoccus albus]|uniref:hypothetical protein n=1 Tax=Salinicoccus albus TaxID=418756 RepID=UPI00036D33DC|nr:hypothetical protein [Salinicoccus albus]
MNLFLLLSTWALMLSPTAGTLILNTAAGEQPLPDTPLNRVIVVVVPLAILTISVIVILVYLIRRFKNKDK